ncbi:MAG: bifunctional demethylmenaquinone methyltransferase/2-methoxy-6-polyprenyl-1,4-benzoquinol methylase UbiE [Planctomycetota bacterium]
MPTGEAVRRMFDSIAPRYDFLNHFLSAGIDRRWRRAAVRTSEMHEGARVLDICCGTGDLSFEYAKSGGIVVGSDFAGAMVSRANTKNSSKPEDARANFIIADSLTLPFPDNSFDIVCVGFGIRNVENLDRGLREMERVTNNGGRSVILEFTTPPAKWMRGAFGFYFHRILPRIGNALAGTKTDAYTYLPNSVDAFPDAPALAKRMELAGFINVRYSYLSGGIAAIHVGRKK